MYCKKNNHSSSAYGLKYRYDGTVLLVMPVKAGYGHGSESEIVHSGQRYGWTVPLQQGWQSHQRHLAIIFMQAKCDAIMTWTNGLDFFCDN